MESGDLLFFSGIWAVVLAVVCVGLWLYTKDRRWRRAGVVLGTYALIFWTLLDLAMYWLWNFYR